MKNCLCGFAESSTNPSIVPSKGETNQDDQKSFSNPNSRLEQTEQTEQREQTEQSEQREQTGGEQTGGKQSKDTRKMPAGHLVDAVKNRDINAAKSLLEEVRFVTKYLVVVLRLRRRVHHCIGPYNRLLVATERRYSSLCRLVDLSVSS